MGMVGDRSAIGHIDTILYTDKTRFALNSEVSDHNILSFHGSTGNGKSMIASLKFLTRIFKSGRNSQTFILAGRDITTLEKRFVQSNYSVFNWHPFRGKWTYKKVGVGGSRITLKTRTGEKHIYLTPFNNVGAYSRILGQTINGVFVDEAVESDEMFLQEIVARINRTQGSWGIMTSNGGDPNHYFYTHILNKSMLVDELVDGVVPTPVEESRYMEEVRNEKYLYVFMSLEDNPAYTQEQLDNFYKLYPYGSFMHYSRVLGVRGFSQDAPFAPYMTDDVWITEDEFNRGHDFYPATMVFSVDSGGHVFSMKDMKDGTDDYGKIYGGYNEGDYGTTSGGHTVMVTGGFTRDYKKFIWLDTYFPNHMHQNINVDRLYERVYNVGSRYPRTRKPYMFVDNADTNIFSMLQDKKSGGIGQVRRAIKRDNSIALDEALMVVTIQQYMMNGNFKIMDTENNRKYALGSMMQANLQSDGKLEDNRSWEADIHDGIRYIFGSMYRMLVNSL